MSVTSVDSTFLINGVPHHEFDFTYIPPPNVSDFFTSAGWWPSTVTYGQPIQIPCTVAGSPADAQRRVRAARADIRAGIW